MEQLKIFENENGKRQQSLKLTSRDYEILQFALEMKFVSIDEIYQKFFKVKQNGEVSKSDCWARDRVLQLNNGGFLKPVHFYTEAKHFYVATFKAYHILKDTFPEKQFCQPNKEIDIRTFYHDWLVTKSRLLLEESGVARNWISEKSFKSKEANHLNLARKYAPDGCYVDSSGRVVAFELELTLKSKSRYQEKIRLYSKLIRQSSPVERSKFDKCLFVCRTKSVADNLKRQALPFGNIFEIKMLEEFGLKDTAKGAGR